MKTFIASGVLACTIAAIGTAQTGASAKLMIVNVSSLSARVTTDAGLQSSTMKGQIAFTQNTDASGQVTLTLAEFNFTGTPVRTSRGSSGPLSVMTTHGSAITRQFSSSLGTFMIDLRLVLHYRLLDGILGFRKAGEDAYNPYTEEMMGQYSGKFQRPVTPQSLTNVAEGAGRFQLTKAVLGPIRSIEFTMAPAAVQIIMAPCDSLGTRQLTLQPVFITNGPGDALPTGSSLQTFIDHAEAIWNKACITFAVRDPIYIPDGRFKIVDDGNVGALMDLVNFDDAIEIFFVQSWNPAHLHGGGMTYSSGTAEAKIVTADANLSPDPPSVNHLAHELGHVLGFCHPGVGCPAPMFNGSAGTVLEPSGFWQDNPDLQSAANCRRAANPLLRFRSIYCCYRPDCENECPVKF
jgi:hypothetical protein